MAWTPTVLINSETCWDCDEPAADTVTWLIGATTTATEHVGGWFEERPYCAHHAREQRGENHPAGGLMKGTNP